MSGIIMSLKAIRDAAEESIELVQLGETADLLDRMDFMADQGKSITEQLKRQLCKPAELTDQGKQPGMSPQKAALHIQRYATEALEGLRTQGATADTEHRLVDLRSLALGIANDLQTTQKAIQQAAREARGLLFENVPNDVNDRLAFIEEQAGACISLARPAPSESSESAGP